MTLLDQFGFAARSLRGHKLRSALTMLGIIIGVAAVVTIVSIGLGARTQIETEIARLGSNLLMVLPDATRRGGVSSGLGGQQSLTEADASALSTEVFGVDYAVPAVSGKVQTIYGNANWNTRLVGTLPDYVAARDWSVLSGRNFTDEDVEATAKVALIGQTTAIRLSPEASLIGQIIRVQRVPFRVIGVLAEKGFSVIGRDQDDIVIVPISSAKSRLVGGHRQVNRDAVEYVLLKAATTTELDSIRTAAARVLRDRHAIRPGTADDFVIRDPSAVLVAQRESSDTLTLLLTCVAAVSLIVGGISVMNIMLVSVAERTHEIGIRVAVGATRRDIRDQFLSEAALVALIGGLLGALLGVAAAYVVESATGWKVTVEPLSLAAAILFSGFVGVISGAYPAVQASRLDPVVALSHE